MKAFLIFMASLFNPLFSDPLNGDDAQNPVKGGHLTEMEYGILVGTTFGDGTFVKRGNSYRLRTKHSGAQEGLVLWKHEKLARICQTTQPPKRVVDAKGFVGYEFYTTSGLYLEPFYHAFYKMQANGKYKKVLTRELLEQLPKSPVILAVLYMDDGSVRNDCYSGKLAFQGFSKEENELFVSIYLAKWGIKATVAKHTEKSGTFYINISAATFSKFIEVIEPILKEVPCMRYKLNELRKPRND